MSSLAVQRLGLERKEALYSTTFLCWGPEYPNCRRLHRHSTPQSRQEVAMTSAPPVLLKHRIQTLTNPFPPRTSFANCPVPPFPIVRSSKKKKKKDGKRELSENTPKIFRTIWDPASKQFNRYQAKQAHKANENQTALTNRHQFPETHPLFTNSPPHHRRDLNKKTRRSLEQRFLFHSPVYQQRLNPAAQPDAWGKP